MRVCFKCKIEKKLSEFYYRKDSNKYRNICKKCTKKRFKVNSKKHYVKNKLKLDEEHKQYYINNIEKLRVASKKYYQTNKDIIKNRMKKYYLKNTAIILERCKKYAKNNFKNIAKRHKIYREQRADYYREYAKNYCRERSRNDMEFKLKTILRNRFYGAMINNRKNVSVLKLTACSIDFLKKYLESKFENEMSWDNYGSGWHGKGTKEWHIDHIKPCASFDLTKESEQHKCFNYTNLQPLWAKDNLEKGRKLYA